MANGVKNIGLVTRTGKINPDYDILFYDAYLLYEELSGLSVGSQEGVSEIISKYTKNVSSEANQNNNYISQNGFGLFGKDSKYFFLPTPFIMHIMGDCNLRMMLHQGKTS